MAETREALRALRLDFLGDDRLLGWLGPTDWETEYSDPVTAIQSQSSSSCSPSTEKNMNS